MVLENGLAPDPHDAALILHLLSTGEAGIRWIARIYHVDRDKLRWWAEDQGVVYKRKRTRRWGMWAIELELGTPARTIATRDGVTARQVMEAAAEYRKELRDELFAGDCQSRQAGRDLAPGRTQCSTGQTGYPKSTPKLLRLPPR